MRSEDTIALVPGLVTWLDGPLSTPTQVGARGYRFGPFTQPGAFAVDPYVLVLYVSGKGPRMDNVIRYGAIGLG